MSKPLKSRGAKGAIQNAVPKPTTISPPNAERCVPEKIILDMAQLDLATDPGRAAFIATVTCSTTGMILATAFGEDAPFAALDLYMGLMNTMPLPGGSGAQT